MKKNYFRLSSILVVVAVLLIWIVPVMAAEKTEFICKETVLGFSDQGEVTFPDGNTHIRGGILLADEWATDPRLVGLNTIVLNANLGSDGTGPMWGTFRIENENGDDGWEGTFAGHLGEWYNAVADGFGAYDGMKMWWNKYFSDCSGSVLEHN
jgi:hypothetical protein